MSYDTQYPILNTNPYLYNTKSLALLTQLSIQNYALIDDINVAFSAGFTTITGETGAGKSILLGGLALVLGKRADLTSLKDPTKKCIIEAVFDIAPYALQPFFQENDLDYEIHTVLRREILPSGKSRAFVNDSPVTLDLLKGLGVQLVDIHSQHQTLRLTGSDFQRRVVDAMAGNGEILITYKAHWEAYKKAAKELQELLDFQASATKEHEYHTFLLQELEAVPLSTGIQEALEAEYEQLSHVEHILEQLSLGHQLLHNEQIGILGTLANLKKALQSVAHFGPAYQALHERIQSIYLETDDLASEVEQIKEGIAAHPERLETVNGQLQQLYALQKKHQVDTVAALITLKEQFAKKVQAVENSEARIRAKETEVAQYTALVEEYALKLREARKAIVPTLVNQLQETLYALGMPSASFTVDITPLDSYKPYGKDEVTFLFSANKGVSYGALKKVASGGELSRIMLAVKSILAEYEQLPTLIFDEIDTGVSGEIATQMGDIMQRMSQTLQLFTITHLPQVASKGQQQFKVYKKEGENGTSTHLKTLNTEERIVELAEMLGGKSLPASAVAHAKQLLQ